MRLALKRTPASDATRLERWFAALTRWRLVSRYSHGGIVINGCLYHSSARRGGLDWEPFDMSNASTGWDFVDLGHERDAAALALFGRMRGTPYDYIGLLGFVLPWNFNDHRRMYCFEWCALAMGLPITARITPERLLAAATQARSSRAFSRPEA